MKEQTRTSLLVIATALFVGLMLFVLISFASLFSVSLVRDLGTTVESNTETANVISTASGHNLSARAGSLTVKAYNQTWLNFDGTDDVLNATLTEDKTCISLWFKNATQNWTNIINNSGAIYTNGVLNTSHNFAPYYIDGNNVYFGKTNSTFFVNGSIDNIRIYNETINADQITAIYSEEQK